MSSTYCSHKLELHKQPLQLPSSLWMIKLICERYENSSGKYWRRFRCQLSTNKTLPLTIKSKQIKQCLHSWFHYVYMQYYNVQLIIVISSHKLFNLLHNNYKEILITSQNQLDKLNGFMVWNIYLYKKIWWSLICAYS